MRAWYSKNRRRRKRRDLISIGDSSGLLDSNVAKFYDIETKEINQAIRNNPDNVPEGYILINDNKKLIDWWSKISATST